MKNIILSSLVVMASVAAYAEDIVPLKQVNCVVTAVDQTPVYFLGPSGDFPNVSSSIDLDLTKKEISEDLVFSGGGHIPLQQIQTSLSRSDKFIDAGVVYFDGQYESPRATYVLAIHVTPEGAGKLQISRRGFAEALELYNAVLHCTPKP